jgi:hypothetical protein
MDDAIEAVGTAAALAAKNNVNPKKLDVKLLQYTLHKQKALALS